MTNLARVLVVTSLVGGFALASPALAAKSLEELLEQTRNARAEQEQIDKHREKEFLANRDRQAALLAEAVRARDAAEAKSKAASELFDVNEKKLIEREDLMNQRLGSLGELFGVVRQVSGDTSTVLYNSLTSAQFPGRDEFFAELGKAKSLPSTEQLERLWFELQREMTETGRVVRFRTKLVESDGTSAEADVVRIGAFVASSGGRYLNYMPTLGSLSVLARQPSSDLVELAAGVEQAKSGVARAAIDPSRGVLLTMLVQRPSVMERIQHGEAVGYLIIVVGVIGLFAALYQTLYLFGVRFAVRRQLGSIDTPVADNPLGRVLASVRTSPASIEEDAEVVELRVSEAVLREVPRLERFQAFLRLAVAAGPLLGLIGTVIGMIITFQSITESGSSDPRLMADGIGQAMIATVLGLGIAVPLLFLNAGLASMSRAIVQILDEQSTGLLAESLERAKGLRRA
jgi:biopolymer transport protein ExbB